MSVLNSIESEQQKSFRKKIERIPWLLLLIMGLLGGLGVLMLFSAAGQSFSPWAMNHAIRIGIGLVVVLVVALLPIQLWAYWAYVLYGLAIVGLLLVNFFGVSINGAQRWLEIFGVRFQPSEIAKLAVIVVMARFFHSIDLDDVNRLPHVMIAIGLFVLPAFLILRQPDLGTSVIILVLGCGMLLIAGISYWYFLLGGTAVMVSIPLLWMYFLQPYQKQRIMTFLDANVDQSGAGYHVTQAKIALGSGGLTGKGLFAGTQSHLDFLPEKHTDFIAAMLAEEFGLIGILAVLLLYLLLIIGIFRISTMSSSHFGRLAAMGTSILLFSYIFVNLGMISNILPVVGVPLPMLSYGGSAMLTLAFAFGLTCCVRVNSRVYLSRAGKVT